MSSVSPDGSLTRRRSVRSPGVLAAGLAIVAIVVSACAPGAATSPSASTAVATPTPVASTAASSSVSPSASVAAAPNCGTEPVVMNAVFETEFDLPFKLSEEFTKQFPNVTWKISQDQFANLISTTPRLLAGDNPPDLIRLPTMVSLVKDNLLKNLDGYVTAFGWDKWPAAQLAQNRVGTDGTRGAGSLFAAGLNYSLTGVFFNKKLATQIGMTTPPKTVAEFEDLLAKAKAAKLQPIMQWNAAASGAGLAFPLQNLMAAYGETAPVNDWIFQKSAATIDTPTNLTAASICSSGSKRVTSRRTRTRSSTPMQMPGSGRAKACSCSMATGRTPCMTRILPGTSASSSSRPGRRVDRSRRCPRR